MSILRKLDSWLRCLPWYRRGARDADLERELRDHLDLEAEEQQASGLSARQADYAAHRALGNTLKIEEDVRAAWGLHWLETLAQDMRYALRMLRKSAGFTAVAVLTLALGIGANTALFSVVNGVLLNPLPYPQPNHVVSVNVLEPDGGENNVSYPDFLDWVRDNHSFSFLAAYFRGFGGGFNWIRKADTQRISSMEVSASFFPTLGVIPILGRNFSPVEDQLNGPPVVILSNGFWKSQFASTRDVIGKTMNLDGTDYSIVGVLPANFYFCCANVNFVPGDVYVPLGADKSSLMQDRKIHAGVYTVGRIKNGVTLAQARADMARVAGNLAATYPEADRRAGIALTPVKQKMVQDIEPLLLVLLAAVGFVLLIACVNVANLLLARSTGRAREFAVRAALGASQRRVVRQLLTESVLLAFAGGALGLLLAWWGTTAALAVLPSTLPRANDVRMDPHVLLFAVAISLAAGILFGLAPALKTSHPDLHETLKEGGRGASGARYRTQSVFVIVEMALAIVLLIGAGLTIRTLARLWSVNPGFDAHNVLTFSIGLPPSILNGNATAIRAELRQVTDRVAAVPGVTAAALLNEAPLTGDYSGLPFWLEGQPKPASQNTMPNAIWSVASPDYLKVMRIPLLRGRFLNSQDDANSPRICVIDEDFARKYFGGQDPIGKHVNFDLVLTGQFQIVGVVGHINQFGLDESGANALYPEFYTPVLQLPDATIQQFASSPLYILRTAGPPDAITGAIRNAVRAFNSKAVLFAPETMDHIVSQTLSSRRFAMILLAAFAAGALLLSSLGIYGVISYIASQRTHEIGIRMALGAQRGDIVRLVLGQGTKLALFGVAVGILAALGLTRLMSSLLFGVSPTDPPTFAAVAIILAGVALLACYIPARRAMKVDPMVALRYE
jgi:putative ABC transport system permease protein